MALGLGPSPIKCPFQSPVLLHFGFLVIPSSINETDALYNASSSNKSLILTSSSINDPRVVSVTSFSFGASTSVFSSSVRVCHCSGVRYYLRSLSDM